MIFDWFNAREAEKLASDLADQFAPPASGASVPPDAAQSQNGAVALRNLLRRADTDERLAGLNFYKKAKFANSFKWRLLENGIDPRTADHVTHSLVLHLSRGAPTLDEPLLAGSDCDPIAAGKTPDLARRARKAFASGEYDLALEINEELVNRAPNQAEAFNDLGACLCKVGRFVEAERRFRQALSLNPDYAEANFNLGNVLRWMGALEQSEMYLRRAVKVKPSYMEARTSLGFTLTLLGRLRDAKPRFEKTLKTAPRDTEALFGLGLIAKMEGRFSEAEALFKRILEYKPKAANALAALATVRRMTPADVDWLRAAKELVSEGIDILHEADLRYSIGKYYDDIGEFDDAFRSFEAANKLLTTVVVEYDRKARDGFVDDMLHTYSKDLIATVRQGGSSSDRPVFVLGMPRSGTSLTEQILASHPSIVGAGEMDFWNAAMHAHESVLRKGLLDAASRDRLAEDYLKLLQTRAGDGLRVIDKTPVNSDYIGIIYSVFPNARFIYMERDPIDVCLSCYFQQFLASMSYSMDLSDLAHYYKGHRRLFKHWESVLPEKSMLVVPYAELVQDQQAWTRRMLDFIGLDWSDRCLSFHETKRAVITASTWQVRQKLYTHSVGRSKAYKKFLGPLKALRN